MKRAYLAASLVTLLVACADSPTTPSMDGSVADGGLDGAARDGMTLDMARDMGARTCPTGEHLCGTTCTEDLADDPAVGCRLGCGAACLAPPAHSVGICNEDGLCDFMCNEAGWTRDGDHCTCTPTTCEALGAVCGEPDNGCGTPLASCGTCAGGGTCMSGACVCMADSAEPNEVNGTARDIGDFDDSPGVEMTLTSFNIASSSDVDWFRADVDDAGFDGNPIVEVSLSGIPAGSNYDLAAFFACTTGSDGSTCESGSSDNTIGHGCSSNSGGSLGEAVALDTDCEHVGTDDDGILFIRVTAPMWGATCGNYSLHINVH